MPATSDERDKLFRQVRHSLGAPIRQIELLDEQLCTLLEIVVEDLNELILNFLVEFQWQSLLGKDIDKTDMAFALTVRSNDLTNQYTYAYSKQVGLQNNGPWELKKDFVDLEAGRQVYQIPADREINQVLWFTPSPITQALLSNYGGIDYGFGGGFAQMGGGFGTSGTGTGGGRSGYYIAPAYDILLTASDMALKNKIVRSDLTYKITAGPDGTKLLHLMSTPGSKLSFGAGIGGLGSSLSVAGCQVWYYYYDTNTKNVDECRKANPDIIRLPNEVPLSQLDYSEFNEPTKITIRQLLIAEAKRTLGRVRGKFGGKVGISESESIMDYESLLSEGNEEKKAVIEKIEERLKRLSSTSTLERAANEAENLNKAIKYNPMGFYFK
jgi:hypothetical protein